jgi:2'-5' RNA ligase
VNEAVRAFVAGELPVAAPQALAEAEDALRAAIPDGVRWVDPSALHLTLKFCGDVPEARIPELARRCASRSTRVDPFEIRIAGLGAFPSAREARVIWAGIVDGARELGRLARGLDLAAARVGVERDRRPYRPHLTLGRLREPRPIPIERLTPPKEIAFRAQEIVLFSSRLSPRGAQHSPLARLPLGAPDEAMELDFAPDP